MIRLRVFLNEGRGGKAPALTVTLFEEYLAQPKEEVQRLRVAAEELLRTGFRELLAQPDEEFHQTKAHSLTKNAELYRRLATN